MNGNYYAGDKAKLDRKPLDHGFRPRLALIGVGSLGSEVCRLLLAKRYRSVLLIDPDMVCARNLPLSRLFQQAGPRGLGRPKVEVLCEIAAAHGLAWQALPVEVADVGLGRLAACDVLLSCTDSTLARVETALAARMLRLPMLDAGVQSDGVAEGRVTWFAASDEAACTLCGLSSARRAELLLYALSPSLGCAAPALTTPMTGAFSAVEATAQHMVELLEGPVPARSSSLRLFASEGEWRQKHIELTRSVECPWHSFPAAEEMVTMPQDTPLRQFLGPDEVLELPWPICLRARCSNCRLLCEPMRRTAAVRRIVACPHCGQTGTLEVLADVHSISARDTEADRTPGQLGLPAGHLYHRRQTIFPGAVDAGLNRNPG